MRQTKRKHPVSLCIGAPKAGTTWLFDNLRNHPDIWTLPYKSVQYFSGLADKARKKKWRRQKNEIRRNINLHNLLWHLDYFVNPYINNFWYKRMFIPAGSRVSIDISPSYSTLTEQQIWQVKNINPDVKVIFFLRNPVDRVWSHTKLNFLSNKGLELSDISNNQLIDYFNSKGQEDRTDYIQIIDRWQSIIGETRFLLRFYDEIADRPFFLLEDICDFLNVSYSKEYFRESAHRNIFKGVDQEIPSVCLNYLNTKYADVIKNIRERYNSYSISW